MDESAELTLRTVLSLFYELLADVRFVLIWVVEAFKGRVREEAFISAAEASFLVVILALFRNVEELIGSSTMVEGLVSVDTVVPIMVFCSISTVLSLIPIKVKQSWLYTF